MSNFVSVHKHVFLGVFAAVLLSGCLASLPEKVASAFEKAAPASAKADSDVLKVVKAEASSVYPNDSSSYYPEHIADGKTDTAWATARNKKGSQGDWIKVYFDGKKKLDKVEIIGGWIKSDSLWRLNSRLKSGTLEFSDGTKRKIQLPDSKTPTTISLNGVETEWVKLTIDEIYAGKRYNQEVAMSEMTFRGTRASVAQATTQAALPQSDVYVADEDIRGTYAGETIIHQGVKKAHGRGVAQGKDRYEGEFKYGVLDGRGVYTWANGNKQEGRFKNGLADGMGTFFFISGEKYEGEYKNNKQHGHGVHTFPDGGKMEGKYVNGKHDGKWVLTFPDGGKIVRVWKDGKKLSEEFFPGESKGSTNRRCALSWPARGKTEPMNGRLGSINITTALWIENGIIRAAADGEVMLMSDLPLGYKFILIKSCGTMLISYFIPARSLYTASSLPFKHMIKIGQKVRRGDKIAEAPTGRFAFGIETTDKEGKFGFVPPEDWLPEVGEVVERTPQGEVVGPDYANPKWLRPRFNMALSAGKLKSRPDERLLIVRGTGRKLDLQMQLTGKTDNSLRYPLKVTVKYEAFAETRRCATNILKGGDECVQGKQRLFKEIRSYTLNAPGTTVKDTVPMNLTTTTSGRIFGLGVDMKVLSDPEIEVNVIGAESL